jgi:hypothetical protein
MTRKTIMAAAALMTALTSVPAVAQTEACIRPIRIFSTQPVDNKTIVITDRQRNAYTVHMRGVCAGMDKSTTALGFRYQGGELGCLRHGDMISYRIDPASPRQTCFIEGVTAGAPVAANGAG